MDFLNNLVGNHREEYRDFVDRYDRGHPTTTSLTKKP